ncbi:MAG: hypothetical protein ACT6U0_05295, partial [Shinella sp.]
MERLSSTVRVLLAAWLALLLLAVPARAAESYITVPGEAARAVGRIVEKLGRAPQLHTIRITDKAVTVLLGGSRPGDVEEWQVRQASRLIFFETEVVAGPAARPAPAMVDDVASGLFSLDAITLGKTD